MAYIGIIYQLNAFKDNKADELYKEM